MNVELDGQGVPGAFLGRYSDDKYPGCDSDGGNGGHIWILCSNALGELYYRNSGYYWENKGNGKDVLNDMLLRIISDIVDKDLPTAATYLRGYIGKLDGLDDDELEEIMENIAGIFASQGDGQLTRVAKFTVGPCNDHMSEQICEQKIENGGGQEIGAHDLTWSYGTVLSAMYYRGKTMEMGVKLWDNGMSGKGWRLDDIFDQNCGSNLCGGQCKYPN